MTFAGLAGGFHWSSYRYWFAECPEGAAPLCLIRADGKSRIKAFIGDLCQLMWLL